MCGIVGGISVERLACVDDLARLDRAIDTLAHRGPDDRGRLITADGRAFLGHRRLSIIDLAGGHQPIADESGRRHLCYNGEIYNFRALREGLAARGHTFSTRTDGETALHLYEEEPRDFVASLGGMFAIAILDEPAGALTLVRDRNGIKPLFYSCDGRTLYFASELKAILALLPQRPTISPEALRAYLRWKYVPAPLTIYAGVFELPAAHRLIARRDETGRRVELQVDRYWVPEFGAVQYKDEREAVERLDGLLRAAVESHMESDVEVGALLSGGVDSSLVVAMASRLTPRRIKTFSVGFREAGFDQLPRARLLARACNTEHHEEYVELDAMTAIPRLVRHFDQPFADSSALACYRVCEVAGRHVKVVLTGDGGDETFAGYKRYVDLLEASQRDNLFSRALRGTIFATSAALFSPEAKFLNAYKGGAGSPVDCYYQRELMCGRRLMNRLLTEPYRARDDADAVAACLDIARARHWSDLDAVQYADLLTYLPGDILAKVDRTSMAWSLECRVPLLDHPITEFAGTLPENLRIQGTTAKYILKRVAERYVPPEVLEWKKKGFRVPIRHWFKGNLLDESATLLTDGQLVAQGILDPAGLRRLLRQQRRPWINLYSLLWSLVFLEHWCRAQEA